MMRPALFWDIMLQCSVVIPSNRLSLNIGSNYYSTLHKIPEREWISSTSQQKPEITHKRKTTEK